LSRKKWKNKQNFLRIWQQAVVTVSFLQSCGKRPLSPFTERQQFFEMFWSAMIMPDFSPADCLAASFMAR
jgi:hypothetical protein